MTKLKKLNAVLALLSTILLLAHTVYSAYAYATMYYNPSLTKGLAIPCIVVICLHAVLAMCIVFLQGDGTRLDLYPGQNKKTMVQRISAALIFPILILHINTFSYMSQNAEAGRPAVIGLIIVVNALFYAVVFAHTTVSVSRACITLGRISSRKTQKMVDLIACIIGAILFVVLMLTVVVGQVKMFLG